MNLSESDCIAVCLPFSPSGHGRGARSQKLRFFLTAALWAVPMITSAADSMCEAHASARGLTGIYKDESVRVCEDRGRKLRAKLPANPIVAIQVAGGLCAYSIVMARTLQDETAADDIRHAVAMLDELAPQAVTAASGHPDLAKAVKGFYAAASAYCQDGTPSAERDYRAQAKTLELEAKLAGIK